MLKWMAGSKLEHALADPKHARALVSDLPAFDHFRALEEITGWLVVRRESGICVGGRPRGPLQVFDHRPGTVHRMEAR